ncbi:MAG: hypothetical protein GX458_00965 [Phyllobacteriaceae bacterium]|nr:hypothetical protein [Phyllobacteriaceae bacterium]
MAGTLIPYTPTEAPLLRVVTPDGELIVPMNKFNQGVLDAGAHETGFVDFELTPEIVPNLPNLAKLELYDANSGICVYRRPPPDMALLKILRLETSMLPLRRLDEYISRKFQMYYHSAERMGRAGTVQLFNIWQRSVYISARLNINSYHHIAECGFETVMLLRDPREELVERLLALQKAHEIGTNFLDEREARSLEEVSAFASTLDFADDQALVKALRRIPTEVAMRLANPLTRQLTANDPNEPARRANLAMALSRLAEAKVVGVRSEAGHFIEAVGELIGAPIPEDAIIDIPKVRSLADALIDSRVCDYFLELDLELYQFTKKALEDSVATHEL